MDVRTGQERAGSGLGLVVGAVVSIVLSAALVISAARAGITPGVSPLVVLFGWVVFGTALGPRLKRFLAISQVTGSAGAAVTAGVVFTAPIVQILFHDRGLDVPAVDVPVLIVASIAGSLLGFGFVGLATRRFLTDPRLPAPEAVACDRLIETAVENPEGRPRLSTSLLPGLLGGFAVNALLVLGWLSEEVHRFKLFALGTPAGSPAGTPVTHVELGLPVAPLYLGIGALLTLPTALLIFAGGLVNAGTIAFSTAHAMPTTTFRWVGGAAMTVAVVFSLGSYVLEGRRVAAKGAAAGAHELSPEEDALLEIHPGARRMLLGSIGIGAVLLVVMMAMVGASPVVLAVMGVVALVLVSLLSGLGGLLSLQVGSSSSPVSGTVFVGMLVLSLTALGMGLSGVEGVVFLVPIVVAACVAICAANDSSQDYKTMQLNGYRVADGFGGQLLGLMGGAIIVPLTLAMAHQMNLAQGGIGLGDPKLPAPQASFFATVLDSLFLEGATPWGPIGAGVLLGLAAVLLEWFGKTRGVILSSLAFAVGIYLPAVIGTGILLGALARFLATFKTNASTHGGILVAAGLITGDAFASLLLGVLIMLGVSTTSWSPGKPGVPSWVPSEVISAGWGQLFLGLLMVVVLLNYVQRRKPA